MGWSLQFLLVCADSPRRFVSDGVKKPARDKRRVKNAICGRLGDLGGPVGGRDHPDGFFLMRRAGLVAYVNRKNRAAGARPWHTQGRETSQTTTQASVRR